MALWYYVDVGGQQKGPVADAALIAQFQSGQLVGEGLIWNETLSDWFVNPNNRPHSLPS